MRKLLLFSVPAVLAFMVTPAAGEPIKDSFRITVVDGQFIYGRGSGYDGSPEFPGEFDSAGYPTPWYYYPNTNWYNQWYYDGPLDATRWKMITYSITIDSTIGPFTIALNWSTPEYSQEYGGFGLPPLPYFPFPDLDPLSPEEEQAWIQRAVIYDYDGSYGSPLPRIYGTFIIPDYNPEWVSIDIRAEDHAMLYGTITHECMERIIPAPGAILLGSIGVGLVGWLRRRRAL